MQLNMEQKRLVENKNMGHYLIRGIAGSGKTTVGVSRVKYLLNNYCSGKEKVLFITYNKSLSKYIKYLYKKVEENRNVSFFDENKDDLIKVITIDSMMYSYFKSYCKINNLNLSLEWKFDNNTFAEAIRKIKDKYKAASVIDYKNKDFLKSEINWIKSCNYMTLEEYLNVDRIGRSIGNNDGPSKLHKNSLNREAIFNLMLEMDKLLMENKKVDVFTENLLALQYIKKRGAYERFKHIIIDEAQDLTRVQLEFINNLKYGSEGDSILFLADVAQSIYPQAWLGKGRSFASIGYDMKGRGSKLSKNYRTTTEIAESAFSLLAKDEIITEDENFVKPSLLEKRGEYPIYRNFTNSVEQNKYILKLINILRKQYSLKDIAVASRINKNLSQMNSYFSQNNVSSTLVKGNDEIDFEEESVKLVTMHSIKGLEFKVVILIDLNKGLVPLLSQYMNDEEKKLEESRERKLLYVGMTRATEKLFMCSYGEASKFIDDIDKRLLIMQIGSKIGVYYNIPYEEYRFSDKIEDKNREEESVRQWIINELIVSYGYPKELIEVEYKVMNFSREGRVDIAILNSNTKEPYIFAETKRRGENLEKACGQLKSYMNVGKCKYGIVTNGDEIIFLDKEFNLIRDIPVCPIDLLPSSLESFKYIDMINKKEISFQRDAYKTNELIVEEGVIKENELQSIKVFSDIAAGIPIEIVDEVRGEFKLPREWIKFKRDLFILNVKGDSMIKAGIDSGDLVVIQKAEDAENLEIVAVYYNGCTTLKRISKMGDTVLLISENPNYEPINITEGELRVMGKLIGVLKKTRG